MQLEEVTEVTQLGFAYGKVGQRYPLATEEEQLEFAQECGERTRAITDSTTADCGDDRLTIGFANGINDPESIENRVVAKLLGAIGLATTKALVAADALLVKDKKTIWDAYITVSANILPRLGMKDAGHDNCGASNNVETSVANAIDMDLLVPAASLLVPDDGWNRTLINKNAASKYGRLQNGFYGNWKPANHCDYIMSTVPENFSFLKVDHNDQETCGHNGSGLYVVTKPDEAYVKNGRALSFNLPLMQWLAHELGQSEVERARILLGFVDDSLHVAAPIVTKDFPVFAQA